MIQAGQGEQVEVEQYRARNQQLRRKLREKDLRIMQLFDCIDHASSKLALSSPHSQINNIAPHSPHAHRSIKFAHSEAKRQKRSTLHTSDDSGNIFKQQSSNVVGRESGKDLRLPALEQRSRVDFVYPREDSILENPEGRPKLVRIPLDRLKPLNSKEVKKRFLMKFQRREDDQSFS